MRDWIGLGVAFAGLALMFGALVSEIVRFIVWRAGKRGRFRDFLLPGGKPSYQPWVLIGLLGLTMLQLGPAIYGLHTFWPAAGFAVVTALYAAALHQQRHAPKPPA
ncbi:hypothetical protein [Actinoplanes sp. L3-i22]|uniref:hypothetical protein n=1 Tax=Actinoplanes sp. L3-i22 TaxID=2836373 RepID=UPI001C769140|nr:hypothetical protein [Actinoplanes sp. L3-i22]BCY10764.1 hypothetical protein L3i22_058520 [Actinoplanes sp. L3-i22]